MKNFQDLEVYQRSSALFPKVYNVVRSWDYLDQKELGSQMIRAANSIHANIAEGHSQTPAEFKRYLRNAIGSCDEIVSHLNDARNVSLIDENQFETFVDEYDVVGKQLTRLRQNWD